MTILVLIIKRLLIYSKIEHKKTNINVYQRELPSNLKPAHVRMLITDGIIDEISLSATILDLIDRGYLEIDKKEINNFLMTKEKIQLYKTEKKCSNLLKYEEFIITWFIEGLGDGKSITNYELRRMLKEDKNSWKYFEHFQALVMISFPIDKYYNKFDNEIKPIHIILFLLGFLPIGMFTILSILSIFLSIYAFGKIVFLTPRYAINQIGADELDSWLDLKRFLKDFSNIEDKNAKMVKIWNYYLSYSIALGIRGKAYKEIKTFFGKNIFSYEENNTTTELPNIAILMKRSAVKTDIQEERKKYRL